MKLDLLLLFCGRLLFCFVICFVGCGLFGYVDYLIVLFGFMIYSLFYWMF